MKKIQNNQNDLQIKKFGEFTLSDFTTYFRNYGNSNNAVVAMKQMCKPMEQKGGLRHRATLYGQFIFNKCLDN